MLPHCILFANIMYIFFVTGDFTFIHVLSVLLLPFCNRHVVIFFICKCVLIALYKFSVGVGLSKVTL